MWISSLDINHSPDWNTTSSYIEKKQDWWSNFDNAVNNINTKLQLDWLKLEVPKTKEQQEKEIMQLIQTKWLKKSFENWTLTENNCEVTKIKDWVFSLKWDNWNIMYFIDNTWEIIFWIVNIIERPFLENWKAFKYAWFLEKKEDWLYNMYKVIGLNEEWEKVLQWPIDINSTEYYQAWLDILFYADILNKFVSLKFNNPEDKEWIYILIKHWSFKFEDLDLFLNKWLITKEIFDYWVDEIRKKVVSQCSDERLVKLWIWIKESDLIKYYKKWYIDKNLATECYKALHINMRKK